jgi:hypothetical protein
MRQTQYPLAPHRTLTTGVHSGFDDGDGFFNPASRAFAALRLPASASGACLMDVALVTTGTD